MKMNSEKQYIDLYHECRQQICDHSADAMNAVRDTVFYVRLRLKNAAGQVSDSDDVEEITTGSFAETPSTVLRLASSSVAGGDLSANINSTAAGTVWRLTGAEYGGNSPSLRDMELTMHLPCTHFRPAVMTSHLEESIIIGTRAISCRFWESMR